MRVIFLCLFVSFALGSSTFEEELKNNSLAFKSAQEHVPVFPLNTTTLVSLMELKAKHLALLGRNCSACSLSRCIGEWVTGTVHAETYAEWLKVFQDESKIKDASIILNAVYEDVYDEWIKTHPQYEIMRSSLAWTWCWKK
jgi:hypothetical protein